jgi:hypothetical protein
MGEHIGRQLDLRSLVGDGAGHVALAIVMVAAIAIGDGKRGIVFDRRIEIGQRAIDIALADEGVAAVVVGQRKAGSMRIASS